MKNLFMLILLALLWGPSFLFYHIGLEGFPPITLAATRLAIGAIVMVAVLRFRGVRFNLTRRQWKSFFLMGFFANALPFTLFAFGQTVAESGIASILNGTTPIYTTIFAHFFISEERFNIHTVAGLVLGFGGILLIFFPSIQGLTGSPNVLGLLAFSVAAISYGVSSVLAKKRLTGFSSELATGAQLVCASITLMPFALIVERPFNIAPAWDAIGAVFFLAVVGTVLAYLLFYKLLRQADATFVSYVTYLIPPVGIALGMIFLGERPHWTAFAGCAFILGGVMLISHLKNRKKALKEMSNV